MPKRPPLLKITNLSTSFQTNDNVVKAVRGINLHINQAEILAIVGESGCGKSVTALSILRLISMPPGRFDSGEIKFNNQDLLGLSDRDMQKIRGNDISMIFQEPMTSLNPIFTIGDQIAESIIQHQSTTILEARKQTLDLLQKVLMPSPEIRIDQYPHELSGGMKQRVMIAMAIACRPALLIADEPTTALDVTIQAQILDLMMDLKDKRSDAAILLITHDLAVVAETCDRVIVMYGGEIQEIAPINKLFGNPLHPYTKALMESMPSFESKSKRLKALKGMVPSIINMGDGCKFCSRFNPDECPCKGTKVNQSLIKVTDDHYVRCHKDLINE